MREDPTLIEDALDIEEEDQCMTTTTKPEIYQFRDCEIDTVERFLKKNGKRVELTTREFDTLLCLVENAGRIVTHDELLNSVWGANNLNVEQSNLPVQVFRIRKALGETRIERYIETVHGMGYRLLARVQMRFSEGVTP